MRERREYLTGCLTGQCAESALIVFSMGLHYLTIRGWQSLKPCMDALRLFPDVVAPSANWASTPQPESMPIRRSAPPSPSPPALVSDAPGGSRAPNRQR